MAIEKTSATRLRKDELPYTTLPSQTIASIQNTDALAIWVYLQTKPEGWIVRAKDIQRHFSIGRDKYRNAMGYLSDMGLVSYVRVHDEQGHLQGTDIHVHFQPTEGLKNRPSVKPTVGESDPLVMEGGVSDGKTLSNADQRGALNEAFELFWTAGMVKVGKAKAKAKFEKLVRDGKEEPDALARKLARDVKARLAAQVFGFDRLHPTTYLNGERWNDEVVQGDLPPNVRSFDEHRQRSDVEVKRGPVRGRPIPYGSTQPDDDGILTLPDGTRCHVDDWDAGTVTWEDQA